MLVAGEWTEARSGGMFEVTNPANGDVIQEIPDGGREEAARAIDAAYEAFPAWAAATAYDRSAILYRAWQLMIERKDHLARTMTEEQGKPLRGATTEVQYAADFLLWFAEEAKRVYGETIPSARPDQRFIVMHQPVGVVAAVTPWNYPVSMITRKVGPGACSRPAPLSSSQRKPRRFARSRRSRS